MVAPPQPGHRPIGGARAGRWSGRSCTAASARARDAPGMDAPARVISVVAADDHPAYLRAPTETLTRAALRVVGISTNGEGAIDFVRALAPDVVLVDLRMPGLSGADVARLISAIYPATPGVSPLD